MVRNHTVRHIVLRCLSLAHISSNCKSKRIFSQSQRSKQRLLTKDQFALNRSLCFRPGLCARVVQVHDRNRIDPLYVVATFAQRRAETPSYAAVGRSVFNLFHIYIPVGRVGCAKRPQRMARSELQASQRAAVVGSKCGAEDGKNHPPRSHTNSHTFHPVPPPTSIRTNRSRYVRAKVRFPRERARVVGR